MEFRQSHTNSDGRTFAAYPDADGHCLGIEHPGVDANEHNNDDKLANGNAQCDAHRHTNVDAHRHPDVDAHGNAAANCVTHHTGTDTQARASHAYTHDRLSITDLVRTSRWGAPGSYATIQMAMDWSHVGGEPCI